MTNHAQVDHIKVCREAWYRHEQFCEQCIGYGQTYMHRCEQGAVLYGEYAASIRANPSCEVLESTLPKEPI